MNIAITIKELRESVNMTTASNDKTTLYPNLVQRNK